MKYKGKAGGGTQFERRERDHARPCWILVFIPRTIGSLRGVKQQGDRARFVFLKQSLPGSGGVNSGRRCKQVVFRRGGDGQWPGQGGGGGGDAEK